MVAQVPFSWQIYDMLGAMGIGLMLAFGYDILRLFLPNAKVFVFLCDVFTFVFGAVWVFSFAISVSKTGVFRWYMALSVAVAYLGYLKIISPITLKFRKAIHFVVLFPFRVFKYYILGLAYNKIVQYAKKHHKKKKKIVKNSKKDLKSQMNIVYNSN